MHCYVINLQPHLGGAEVFTLFFTRALLAGGCTVTLIVSEAATCWSGLVAEKHAALTVTPVASDRDIPALLPARAWIVTHAPVSEAFRSKCLPQL